MAGDKQQAKIIERYRVYFKEFFIFVFTFPGFLPRTYEAIRLHTVISHFKKNEAKRKRLIKLKSVIEGKQSHDKKEVCGLAKSKKIPGLFIKYFSNTNQIILDTFGGSGSTLIAAHDLKRRCLMMEIEPKYCDLIIERYANYTETPEEKIRENVRTD